MPYRKVIRTCQDCLKKYWGMPKQKYCSRNCLTKSGVARRPRNGKTLNCKQCNKEFYRKPSQVRMGKHCSSKCMGITYQNRLNLKCIICKKDYTRPVSQVKWHGSSFCSYKCANQGNRGKRIKSWKGGTSYKKAVWVIFSKYIRNRDKGICISCGKKGSIPSMDAGHYIPKTAGLSIYFDERNVNCQCTYCNIFMHGNLSRYAIALRRKYGDRILEELDRKRWETRKISIPEYQAMKEEYTKKLEALLFKNPRL